MSDDEKRFREMLKRFASAYRTTPGYEPYAEIMKSVGSEFLPTVDEALKQRGAAPTDRNRVMLLWMSASVIR